MQKTQHKPTGAIQIVLGVMSAAALFSAGVWALLGGVWQGGGAILLAGWLLVLTHNSLFYLERVTFFALHHSIWQHLLALPLPFYAAYRPLQRGALGRSLEEVRAGWHSLLFDGGFAAFLVLINLGAALLVFPPMGWRLLVWLFAWLGMQAYLLYHTAAQQRRRIAAQQAATHAAHQMLMGIQTLPIDHIPTWAEQHAQTQPITHRPTWRRATLLGLLWVGLPAEGLAAWGLVILVAWASLRLDAVLRQTATWLPHAQDLRAAWRTSPQLAPHPPETSGGMLSVENVTLRYNPHTPPILRHLSFDLYAGECVALVGDRGKSTLLKLLLGFEEPEAGHVYYRGIQRQEIGYVLQDSQLWMGSLKQNVLGHHNLPLDAAWRAAEIACIDDLIRDLKMQMLTPIDDGGAVFSRGQQQRLLLARALVHQPRLLLLDEAMNAIDEATCQRIHAKLSALGITRLMVVYRPSEMQSANRILLMHDGRIIASGSYAALYQEQAIFRQLVAHK